MYMEIRHLHHTYTCDEIFFAQMKKATNYLLIRRFCYQSETRYSSFFLNSAICLLMKSSIFSSCERCNLRLKRLRLL